MKCKILIAALAAFATRPVLSQTIFTVTNFSNNYSGKILIEDTAAVFSKGSITIIENKSGKKIIEVASDELALSLHDGAVYANIKELPYGEQSLVMYNDFNFDGLKDFAIEDGQNSCYHGPSFQIYLATKTGFKLSEAFTRLAQEYCGMFTVDYKKKIISTMTKSGCCWHQFAEYKVINNEPQPIKIIEEDYTRFPAATITAQTWNGKKMVEKMKRIINLEDETVHVVFSFTAEKNQQQVVLYTAGDSMLHYVLINKEAVAAFMYPEDAENEEAFFKFNQKRNELSFQNKNAVYNIHNKINDDSINILNNNQTYHWKSKAGSAKGKLDNLAALKLLNVIIE